MNDDSFAELLQTFRDEAAEAFDNLFALLEALPGLEADARPEALADALRIAHNMKGSSSMVGVEGVTRLTHGMEDVLGPYRGAAEPPREEIVADLLAAVTLCQRLAEGQTLPEETEASLERLLRWTAPASKEEPAPKPPRSRRKRASRQSVPSASKTSEPQPGDDPTPEHPDAAPGSLGTGERTAEEGPGSVRVEAARLDRLMAHAEELLIAQARQAERHQRIRDLHDTLIEAVKVLPPDRRQALTRVAKALDEQAQRDERQASEFGRLTVDISEAMKSLRMLPLAGQGPFWRRITREAAQEAERKVRLEIDVGDTELDKQILDALREPFLHLLRNAVDHGIEPSEERLAKGKEEEGRIIVRARMVGAMVQLSVDDDGRGIDPAKISESALQRDLVTAERLERMSDDEKRSLLFRSGFSTAERVSRLSGRGVGLDVVARRLQDLGGHVRLRRGVSGTGTCFDLVLPLSLLSLRGLLVRAGSSICALPIDTVERTFRIDRSALRRVDGVPTLELPGAEPLRVRYLASFLEEAPEAEGVMLTVVVVSRAGLRLGLVVGEILGEQEFVTHRLTWNLQSVPGISGALIRADGSVATVLDAGYLFLSDRGTEEPAAVQIDQTQTARVLVVDDSLTSRTLERNILARAGYQVEVAEDGDEAWQLLAEQTFDLVVSDVEMPRIDGLELTRRIRRSPGLRRLPVILVTTLGNERQIHDGALAGADEYIVKGQFEQSKLLEAVARHL